MYMIISQVLTLLNLLLLYYISLLIAYYCILKYIMILSQMLTLSKLSLYYVLYLSQFACEYLAVYNLSNLVLNL